MAERPDPQRCSCPNHSTREYVRVQIKRGLKIAERIKVANQLTLSSSWIIRWARESQGPNTGEEECSRACKEDSTATTGLKMVEGPRDKECRQPVETAKGKEAFPPGATRGTSPANTFILKVSTLRPIGLPASRTARG